MHSAIPPAPRTWCGVNLTMRTRNPTPARERLPAGGRPRAAGARAIHRAALAAALAAAWLPWCPRAEAVIRVDFPVSMIYGSSEAVLVGKVAAVNPSNRVVEVKAVETLKGVSASRRLRVQILSPAPLIKRIAAGRPLVLFVGRSKGAPVGVVHVAGAWLLAKLIPKVNPPAWRVVDVYDGRQSFPGRTVALARLLRQLKAGKTDFLDAIEPKVFRGGPRKLADVMPNAAFVLAADFNGDGKDDVLIGGPGRVQLLLSGESGLAAADQAGKWHLGKAKGDRGAAGDVNNDRRIDLLLGGTLWLNTGGAFAPQTRGLDIPADAAALALADATGDGNADAVALTPDGRLAVWQSPGKVSGPWKKLPPRQLGTGQKAPLAAAFAPDWGDTGKLHVMAVGRRGPIRWALDADGGPPADMLRLTGAKLNVSKGPGKAAAVVAAVAMDINGDGRLDYLILTGDKSGGWMLVNRGFGAFIVNPEAGAPTRTHGRHKVPWKRVTRGMLVAAGDIHGDKFDDLLILTPDGKLYELSNTPYKVKLPKPPVAGLPPRRRFVSRRTHAGGAVGQ